MGFIKIGSKRIKRYKLTSSYPGQEIYFYPSLTEEEMAILDNYWTIKLTRKNKRKKLKKRWKYARWKQGDYILLSTKNGRVWEHHFVMEKHIGRKLYDWEIVHHINGIKDDNRIENLLLLPRKEHNTKVQEVYKENQKLKLRIRELEQN